MSNKPETLINDPLRAGEIKESNKEQWKKEVKTIADDYAKSKGKAGIKALMDEVNDGLGSPNTIIRNNARALAGNTVQDLLPLVLQQRLVKTPDFFEQNFVNVFDDGPLNEGNSREYVAPLLTGAGSYVSGDRIADQIYAPACENDVISMYNTSKQLDSTSNAYQFKKVVTLQEPEYIPYFKSGRLAEFLEKQVELLYQSYSFFFHDKLCRYITSTIKTNAQNKLVGSGANMFEAMNEFFKFAKKMTIGNKKFNYSATSKKLSVTPFEDQMWLVNSAVDQLLDSGVASQLYNAQFFGPNGKMSKANFVVLGNQITYPDNSSIIDFTDEEYLDDQTIICMSKDAIKHCKQVERIEKQEWANNMCVDIVLHIWGAFKILKWGQVGVYTNTNLVKIPGSN